MLLTQRLEWLTEAKAWQEHITIQMGNRKLHLQDRHAQNCKFNPFRTYLVLMMKQRHE